MPSYTAKTRNVGRRPRSKRLRELGGSITINNGSAPDLDGYELLSNKVAEVDSESTDEQYPTAKCLYDALADIATAIEGLSSVFAAIGHVHAIGDITGLQTALDDKAAADHTHSQYLTSHQTVTNKAATIGTSLTTIATIGGTNITAKIGSYAAASHVHAIADITNLQTALDGKAASDHTHSQYHLLAASGETAIANNADLNNFTTAGVYGTSGGHGGSSVAATLYNKPIFTGGFRLIVESAGGDGTYIRQTIITKAGRTFTRTGYSGNWFSWQEYAMSDSTVTVDSALSDSSTNPVQNKVVKAALDGKAASDHTHTTVVGSYLSPYGGQRNPNYFGKNRVGFLMMNTTVNGNSQFKDWLIMDCYDGNDVGGGVAIGVNRQSLGAYIMRSAVARTSWEQTAELLGTHNYANYALPLTGGTISDTAITTAKTVLDVVAGVSSPSTSNNVYGIKATLTQTGSNVNTNSAAIYGVASAGYAGLFSGMVKVSSALTANSVSAATVYQTSDDRLKDYVGDFHFALADIDKIPLRFFTFKDDPDKRVLIGTSAQAVQKVLPEIVGSSRTASEEDSEEYLNVDYSKLALVALDCVRQLRDEVAALRAEIEELKRGR